MAIIARGHIRKCPRCGEILRDILLPGTRKIGNKVIHEKCLEPFCIYTESIRFLGEWRYVWHVCIDPDVKTIEVSKTEAKKLINEFGLVLSCHRNDDLLYDTPDGAFKKKFQGFFARKEKELADKIRNNVTGNIVKKEIDTEEDLEES